jgi:hypothetical protein
MGKMKNAQAKILLRVDLAVDGMIILKRVVNKYVTMLIWIDLEWNVGL